MDENHRGALRTSLLVVERDLRAIIQDLTIKSAEGILYRVREDVNPEARQEVLKIVNMMLEEISKIKRAYHLEIREQSLVALTNGRLGEAWVILEDLRPEKLDDYGKLPETEKDIIRPHIFLLLGMVEEALDHVR